MVKKRTLSGSEYKKESAKKHNINSLVRNANISSKNHLLKDQLLQNGLQNILKKNEKVSEIKHKNKLDRKRGHELTLESDSSNDSDHEEFKLRRSRLADSLSSKVSNKIKKRKREEVSSSSESTSDESKPASINIKEEIVSATESESEADKRIPSIISPKLQQSKVTKLSGFVANKLVLLDSTTTDSKKVKKQKKVERQESSTSVSSDNDNKRFTEKSNKVILNTKLHEHTDDESNSSEEEGSSHPQLYDYEKMMEDIEKRVEKPNTSIPSNEKYKPLKEKLEEMYPGIKRTKSNITIDLSNTEDIYLFRIPKNVDPSSLEDVELNLDRKCKIKIGKKYIVEPTPNRPSPTLIVANNSEILNFKGDIRMEKYIKTNKNPELTIPEIKPVPLPDNLKKRHPLFGSEYKQKIKLSDHLKQKVIDARENLLRKEKSKKKKHKKVKEEVNIDDQNETIFALLNNHSQVNNKIKRELPDENPSTSSSVNLPSKLDSYFNGVNETLRRIKSEILTETESEHPDNFSIKKKKKNKKPDSWNTHVEETSIDVKSEPTNIPEQKHRLLVNSTLIPDITKTPSFSPEISRIKFEESSSEKTPKKHKKKDSSAVERSLIEKELISDILDGLKSDLITSSKKVKRKKYNTSK